MSVVTSRSDYREKPDTHGAARVAFALRDGRTRLADLYQHDPLRVMFPTPGPDEPPCAAIVTTSGGLVGGDVLDVEIDLGPGAMALTMAQAAEKVYRSTGADCRIDVSLRAAPGAWLEYLPQETILFEGARMRRRTGIDAAAGARVLAGEMLVFGRRARGERITTGLIRDSWEVRVDGRLIWADALHMDGALDKILSHPAAFDGAGASATAIYVADDAGALLDTARGLLESGDTKLRAGASIVNGVLVARWLAHDPFILRRGFGAFWSAFRGKAAGLPCRMPRLWEI